MLYTPPAFRIEDLGLIQDHIDATGLATLITVGVEGPLVTHLPLLLDRARGEYGTLIGHLARGNPQWTASKPDAYATAVFQGPDAYISPSWYAAKAEHGKVVPTWNYAVVHARGTIRFIDDRDALKSIVDRLTTRHEAARPAPWSTDDAPAGYIERQLKGIVGVELEIAGLDASYKLSQNRAAADRDGVIAGLGASENESARAASRLMAERRS